MNPPAKMIKCRVCIAGGRQLIPFARFDTDRKPYRLAEAIAAVGGVQVESDDGLPQYCCVRCLREVEAAYKLRQRCQESDRKMKQMFRTEAESAKLMRQKPGVVVRTEELVFTLDKGKSRLQVVERAAPVQEKIVESQPLTRATKGSDDRIIANGDVSLVRVKREMPQAVEIKKEKEEETEQLLFKEEIEESRLQEPVQVSTIKQEIDNVTETIEDPQLQLTYDVMEIDDCVSNDEEEPQRQQQDDEKEEYFEVMAVVESSEEENNSQVSGGVFKCFSCKQSYRTVQELEDHVKIVGDYNSAKELETRVQCKVYTSTVLASLRINNQIKDNNYESRTSETAHRPELDDKSRICCGCTHFCASPEELIAHSQEVHSLQRPPPDEQRPWVCDICFQNFPNRIERFEHKQQFLKKGKKYPCKECGKGFFSFKSLQSHQNCHSSKSINCSMCHYDSVCPQTLKAHVKRHCMPDGTFRCLECARCFDSPVVLAKHSIMHPSKLPFSCPHCPRVFNVKKWLTKHISLHVKQGSEIQRQGSDQDDRNE